MVIKGAATKSESLLTLDYLNLERCFKAKDEEQKNNDLITIEAWHNEK